MRWLVAAIVVLAGCSAPSEPVADIEEPVEESPVYNITRAIALEGAVTWHEEGDPVFDRYSQAAQAVAHPCLWDDAQEVYFTNQPLGAARLPNGTQEVIVTFDWDDTSYLRDELRVAHRGANDTRYMESAPFARGEEMRIPVDEDDWARGDDRSWGGGFELWACLDTDSTDAVMPPSIFAGELRYKVEIA